MGQFMKANLKIASLMERENLPALKVMFMKETGWMENVMDMVIFTVQMVESIAASGLMIFSRVLARNNGQMDPATKENMVKE